jgi:imidazolonepropionase-like amidohydrolase
METIEAAARVGAMTIGQAKNMGTVEPGKLADIVFLAKDPLANIDNVKSVVMTVKRGTLYRRSHYQPITRDEAQGEF